MHGYQNALCGVSSASALGPDAFGVSVRVNNRKRCCFKGGWVDGWVGAWVSERRERSAWSLQWGELKKG